MKVKPTNPDAVLHDPETMRRLPAEGGEVPESNFWVRRLLAGEIERIDEQPSGGVALAAFRS
jgi:hypothetical protein